MIEQRDWVGIPDADAAAELIAAAPLDLTEKQWEGTLVALVAVMEAAFRRAGLDEEQATRLALAGMLAQAEYAGGRQIYIPQGMRLRNALRDAEIYRKAKRGNIAQLVTEYGLTEVRVYEIIRQQRQLHLARVQRNFDF